MHVYNRLAPPIRLISFQRKVDTEATEGVMADTAWADTEEDTAWADTEEATAWADTEEATAWAAMEADTAATEADMAV